MLPDHTVIYAARTQADAYALRNLLAESGIQAVVVTDMLDVPSARAAGSTVAARVVVPEQHAEHARHIAQVFDRKSARTVPTGDGGARAKEPPGLPATWPRCPECDTPRSTRCEYCGTVGTAFDPADFGPAGGPDADLAALTAATRAAGPCACSPEGCAPILPPDDERAIGREAVAGEASEVADAADAGDPDSLPDSAAGMLICPMCDEPFRPQFARLCAWCNHEFPDGFEVDLDVAADDPFDGRAIVAAVILAVVLLLLSGYFMYVV